MPRLLPLNALNARLAFNFWGWATLLVVLLSAAPTGGALRTQWIGSAFDPATYSVTTGPKRFRVPTEVRREAIDPGEKPATVAQPLLAANFVPTVPSEPEMALADAVPIDAQLARIPFLARNLAPRGPPPA